MIPISSHDKLTNEDICTRNDDELNCVMKQLVETEDSLFSLIASDEQHHAEMKIKSGRILLQAKAIVKSRNQKWEIEAPNIIPKNKDGKPLIESTCRCERMKVAKIKDVDEYVHIGWRKLVKLSQVVWIGGDKPIKNYLKMNGYDTKALFAKNLEEFELAVDTCLIRSKLKASSISIKTELIEQAVRRKIVFDDKFIKHLASMQRPDAALRAKLYYNVTKPIKDTDNDQANKVQEIEEMMEKLAKLMSSAVKNNEVPRGIPLYMYDDLAHWNGIMFKMASEICP